MASRKTSNQQRKRPECHTPDLTITQILEPILQKAGETTESFKTYRRIKTKIQNGQINICEGKEDIENQAKKIIKEELFCSSSE